MKRMLCYFLICALILAGIAGCVTPDPTTQSTQSAEGDPTTQGGTETTATAVPGFTVPSYELKELPTIGREQTGALVEYDPDRELYILASQSSIIYCMRWSNNCYSFRIFSKKPLDVDSISVTVPVSHPYTVRVREYEHGGVEAVSVTSRMEISAYRDQTGFTYPMYLAYLGKDFRELAQLRYNRDQMQDWFNHYYNLYEDELTFAQYTLLQQPYEDAKQAYEEYLNADYSSYLALTEAELPQFYVYGVLIDFDSFTELAQEESFTQIEITIGDEVYVQDVGNISLIKDWDLPAPIDWTVGYGGIDGILGNTDSAMPYNDGELCISTYFRFTVDRYKLLEELVMLNPVQKVERVWLEIQPTNGKTYVVEWDMSEPYEVYPGDYVVVYAAYSDPALNTPGYQTMTDAYLLYSTDGEQYLKFSHCETGCGGSDYFWNAVLFDGIDMEDYYWEYYYRFNEPWRFDPAEDPSPHT